MKPFLILLMVLGLMVGPVAVAKAGSTGDQTALVRLAASDEMPSDRFGVSVAVSGDTALIGAPTEDAEQGAAYVFTRIDGLWTEQAKLVASDRRSLRKFGFSVGLSGDTAVVGGSLGIVGGSDIHADRTPGSAYVFERVGDRWIEQAKLTAPDGAAGDDFGTAVAVSGDTVVVGAGGIGVGGAAYVFVRAGGAWSQQAKLTASQPAVGDKFGFSVAASGDTAVVGAQFDDVGDNADQGSAYVFTRDGARWSEEKNLTAEDGASGDHFGFSVGASADTVVVGAVHDDVDVDGDGNGSQDQGSAYVFERAGGAWPQQAHLIAGDGSSKDLLGRSAAVSGDTVILGAQGDIGENTVSVAVLQQQEGSAYVFARHGAIWPERTKLFAVDGLFGVSVAISRGTAVIGAPFENLHRGAAYVWDDPTACRHRCGSPSTSNPPTTRTATTRASTTSALPTVT